jgi:hypothetical protein
MKLKTNGVYEITSLIILGLCLIAIFIFMLSIIATGTTMTEYGMTRWTDIYQSGSIFVFKLTIKVFLIQIIIMSISMIIHTIQTARGIDHELLIVGIDFWNFIKGKKLHSIKILQKQFSKLKHSHF